MNRLVRIVTLTFAVVAILPTALASTARAAYVFTNVADTTTAAPVGTFSALGVPALSGSTVAFSGSYNGGANTGYFTASGGAVTPIALEGAAAPVGTFDPIVVPPALSGSTAVFRGIYNSGADRAILTGSGGALTTIAQLGDSAPVGTFTAFGADPAISGSTAAFLGSFDSGHAQAIFTGSGGALTTIVKKGDTAPVGTFSSFGIDPAISGSTVAFQGLWNIGANLGIFTGSGGALTTIVQQGDSAPIGTFTGFRTGSISLSGSAVAFFGIYNGGANSGIFTGSGGALTTIVKAGDVAPIGTFSSVDGASLSGSTAAFSGIYNGGADTGIFTGSGGALTRVILTGDSLFGSTVTNLSTGRSGTDAGSLAFAYTLADGRSGLAIATVPEPSTMLLACLAVLGLTLFARRTRSAWSTTPKQLGDR